MKPAYAVYSATMPLWNGTCPRCGKRQYPTRRAARKAARTIPSDGHLNAYRCGRYWHLGHLPAAVIAGELSRADINPKDIR